MNVKLRNFGVRSLNNTFQKKNIDGKNRGQTPVSRQIKITSVVLDENRGQTPVSIVDAYIIGRKKDIEQGPP
jgi:hypothetical protein